MSNEFGRRAGHAKAPAPPAMMKFARAPHAPTPAPPQAAPIDSVDAEIREWKKARGSHFPIKLLALVASASFGVASIALPARINAWAEWPLLALTAASLYAGFRRRKR
jgi:hypothetical protein